LLIYERPKTTHLLRKFMSNEDIIYSNLTTKISCPNGNSDCNYCATIWASGADQGVFTVSGAGSYVVTADYSDPSQEGTYSMDGTYVWSGFGYWNKTGCTSNDCFSIERSGQQLTITCQGNAGGPAWIFNNPDPQDGSCPPWTYSGWTKNVGTPPGIIIEDPAPTVTKDDATGARTSCLSAGGVYSLAPYFFTTDCRFYSPIPTGQDSSSYCGSLPLNNSPGVDWFPVDGVWNPTTGVCCNDICQPPLYYNANSCTDIGGCPS
jgi:hypothetical protein